MASPLANALQFLKDFGFFDVVLPFLLIFTIVFGILEKTKVFGTEDGKPSGKPQQRINAMVAFVIALFFVAIPSLVASIQVSLPQIAMLLIVIIVFLMLIASLASGDKPFSLFNLESGKTFWIAIMYILIFTGVIAIFMNSFGWLDPVLDYVKSNWSDTLIVSLIFLVIIVVTIYIVVKEPTNK